MQKKSSSRYALSIPAREPTRKILHNGRIIILVSTVSFAQTLQATTSRETMNFYGIH